MRVYNKLQHKNGMERSMKVQIRMCRSYPSKIFFTLSLGFLECLFAIVIGGYWIVNILSWIIQAIFSIAFAFLKQVERDFFYPQSSISIARNFPFCSSSPISYFASPFAPLRSFLRLLCCHWLPFFPHTSCPFYHNTDARAFGMCLKNLSFKNVSCAKQWQIPIVLQSAEKKNDCAPNHRYNLWNLLRKRYIFERRFLFFFLSRDIFHGIFFLSIRSMLHSFWILSLFSPSLSAFGEFSWSIFRLCAFKWKI